MRSLLAVSVLVLLAAPAAAQPAAGEPASARVAADAGVVPVVIRPQAGLEDLAERVARVLARRSGRPVQVGAPPPGDVPEAVPEHQIALARGGDASLRVVVGGRGPPEAVTDIRLPAASDAAVARALALAIESMADHPDAAEHLSRPEAGGVSPDPARRPADRWGEIPEPDLEPIARPTIYLRMMLGVSPLRGTPLVGPGAGLGLCIGAHCAVIEADLSLVPQEAEAQDGTKVRYRSVNASTRLQFRPLQWDDISAGFSFGLLTRIGNASLVGKDASQLVTNLGVRATIELAWRFAEPFEVVFEGGADVAITRARFVRYESSIFLEDRWTPWMMAGLRMRP